MTTPASPPSPAEPEASGAATAAETAPADAEPRSLLPPLAKGSALRRLGLAVIAASASGLLLALSYPDVGLWPLAWVALVPWILALPKLGRWTTLIGSWVLIGVWFLMAIGWLSAISPSHGWLVLAIVVATLGVHLAVFGWIARAMLLRAPLRWWTPAGIAAAWTVAEYFRVGMDLPLPFPWLKLGASQAAFLPIAQIADLGGVHLLSFVVAFVGASVAVGLIELSQLAREARGPSDRTLRFRQRMEKASRWSVWRVALRFGTTIAVVSLVLTYGLIRILVVTEGLEPGPMVATIQPNETFDPAHNRFNSDPRRRLSLSAEAYDRHAPDLIVWPETTLFGPEFGFPRGVLDAEDPSEGRAADKLLQDFVEIALWPAIWRTDRAADEVGRITTRLAAGDQFPPGMPYWLVGTAFTTQTPHPFADRPYDHVSAHLVAPDGEMLGRHDKLALVPVGEFIPYMWIPGIADAVRAGMGHIPNTKLGEVRPPMWLDVSRVEGSTTPPNPFAADDEAGRYRFAAPICYEMVFPHVVRRVAAGEGDGGRPVDFLVNPSNEAWYGVSAELTQMVDMVRLRAIESRRSIVRATNTGVSGIIDPTGFAILARDRQGRLREAGPMVFAGRVPISDAFSLYREVGDWVTPLSALLVIGLLARMRWLRRRPGADDRAEVASVSEVEAVASRSLETGSAPDAPGR